MNLFSLFSEVSKTIMKSDAIAKALPCPFCGEVPNVTNDTSWVDCLNGCRGRNPFWSPCINPVEDWNRFVHSYDDVADDETLRCPKCGSLPFLHLDGELFRLRCRCDSGAWLGPFKHPLEGKRCWNEWCRDAQQRMDGMKCMRDDIEKFIDLAGFDSGVDFAETGASATSEPVSAGVATVTVIPDLDRFRCLLSEFCELIDRYDAD